MSLITWLGFGVKIISLIIEQWKNKIEKDNLKKVKRDVELDKAFEAVDKGDFASLNHALDRLRSI